MNPQELAAAMHLFAADVVRRLFGDNAFIQESRDHSEQAVGKTVNVVNTGATKTVINGTTVDMTPLPPGDTVKSYPIDEYQTIPTKLAWTEEILTNHNNREEIMYNHEQHFRKTYAERLIHNWAANHTLLTTGEVKTAKYGTGTRKKSTYNDWVRLSTYQTEQDLPLNGRCALVSANTYADLLQIDEFISFDHIKDGKPVETGLVGMILGYKIYLRSRTVLKEIPVGATEGNHAPSQWLEDDSLVERTIGETATDTIIAWHPRYTSTALNSDTLVSIIPAHGGVEISLTAVGGGSKLSKTDIGVVTMCETVVTAPDYPAA